MPDMNGKTVLVTGATSGIGLETARELASLGATLLVHGRTPEKAQLAAAEIAAAASGSPPIPVHADFEALSDVRGLAAQVTSATSTLDVLINNAGVFEPRRRLSADGYEVTFAVNHLAHFLLTHLLATPLCAATDPRIITVSSVAHFRGEIELDDLMRERGYRGYAAYAGSKLANVLFAAELAKRAPCIGATSNSLHPGTIATKLLRRGFPLSVGGSLAKGAETPVYLASSPDVAGVTGTYFVERHPAQTAPRAHDPELQRDLWEVSAELVGLRVASCTAHIGC